MLEPQTIGKKKSQKHQVLLAGILAEGEGFEPSIRNLRMPPFQGGTINHSAILPWMFPEHHNASRVKARDA